VLCVAAWLTIPRRRAMPFTPSMAPAAAYLIPYNRLGSTA
jgi:hypothetical protein